MRKNYSLIIPILLVLSQPDLGTSVLIALSGIAVIWLAGINIKYIVYSSYNLIKGLLKYDHCYWAKPRTWYF